MNAAHSMLLWLESEIEISKGELHRHTFEPWEHTFHENRARFFMECLQKLREFMK